MGLCLFFLPKFPGAMYIQGATFIPDSRVDYKIKKNQRGDPYKMYNINVVQSY